MNEEINYRLTKFIACWNATSHAFFKIHNLEKLIVSAKKNPIWFETLTNGLLLWFLLGQVISRGLHHATIERSRLLNVNATNFFDMNFELVQH